LSMSNRANRGSRSTSLSLSSLFDAHSKGKRVETAFRLLPTYNRSKKEWAFQVSRADPPPFYDFLGSPFTRVHF